MFSKITLFSLHIQYLHTQLSYMDHTETIIKTEIKDSNYLFRNIKYMKNNTMQNLNVNFQNITIPIEYYKIFI